MLKVFWVGLCVTVLILAFVTASIFADRQPINFTSGVAGGGDSVKFSGGVNGHTIVSTFVDTNDARNIDSIFSGIIYTDHIGEEGLVMWFAWDSLGGDSSYPSDSIGVYLYTSYEGSNWRNPDDSITKCLRGDTLGRYGYLTYKYLSDSIKDTLFYFDTWFRIDIWDSTSDSVNVNTEHKYKFRCGYNY